VTAALTEQLDLAWSAATRAEAHAKAHATASATARLHARQHALAELRDGHGRWVTGPEHNDALDAAATGRHAGAVRLHDHVLYGKTEPTADRFGLQQRSVPMEVTGLHHHWEGSGKRRKRFTDLDLLDPDTGQTVSQSVKDGVSVKLYPREDVHALQAAERKSGLTSPEPAAPTQLNPAYSGWQWPSDAAGKPAPAPKPPPAPAKPKPVPVQTISQQVAAPPPPAATRASMDIARKQIDPTGLSPAEREAAAAEYARVIDSVPDLAPIFATTKVSFVDNLGDTGLAAPHKISLDSSLIHDPARMNALVANRGEKGWGKNFMAEAPQATGPYSGLRYVITHESGHVLSWRLNAKPGGAIAAERAVAGALAGHDFPPGIKGLHQAQAVLSDRKVTAQISGYAHRTWEELNGEAFAAYSLGGTGKAAAAGKALADTARQGAVSPDLTREDRAAEREIATRANAPSTSTIRQQLEHEAENLTPTSAPPAPAGTMAAPGNYPGAPNVTQESLSLARNMVDATGDGITPQLHEVASREMAKLLDLVPAARTRIATGNGLIGSGGIGMKVHWQKDLIKNENSTGATNLRTGMSLDPLLLTDATAQDADRKRQLGLPPEQSVYADEPGNTGSYQAFRDVITHEFGHVLGIEASEQSTFEQWKHIGEPGASYRTRLNDTMNQEIATALAGKPMDRHDVSSELTRVGAQVDGYAAADPQEALAEMFDVAVFGGNPPAARQVGQILARYASGGQPVNLANEDTAPLPAWDLCQGRTFSPAEAALLREKSKLGCSGFPRDQEHATLISDQLLDLAGWDTAWLHERRGRGGEWVKNLPGGFTQATFPGMPHAEPGPNPERRDAELLHQLSVDQESGIKSESKPHAKRGLVQEGGGANYFGNSADTQVVTFNNGHKWVRKRGLPEDQVDNEVIASRVSDAVGAGAPGVVSPDNEELWEQFAKGAKPAIEWMGGTDEDEQPLGDHDPEEAYESDQGIRIGILDDLIGNGDRHFGNWMVKHDRKAGDVPVPIDHGGLEWNRDKWMSGSGPFGEYVWAYPEDTLEQIPRKQWDQWRGNLNALEPEFDARGMDTQYGNMMANFDAMSDMAGQAGGRAG
jgi:hypothetical protein